MKLTASRILTAASLAAFSIGLAGCQVHVDKGPNGEDKNVQVETPFGGVHVNTGQTTAADLGLPVYPGAHIVPDKDNDKSADVGVGFGQWEVRVKVVNYASSDSQVKVEGFYKKALARYGDVIACQGNAPVGRPTITSEGLTCQANHKNGPQVHVGVDNKSFGYWSSNNANGLELKAGSPRHQHIVGFDTPVNGQTRFALVDLELPSDFAGDSGKSD